MTLIRSLTLTALAITACAVVAAAAPVTYAIDRDHTEVGFDVRHFFSRVHGHFAQSAGTIVFDDADPANIRVDATAEVKSISTDNERRDGHLRSADFFAADSFPTISFKSTKVTAAGRNKYRVTGDLTMRGVTRPVVFDAEFLGAGAVGVGGQSWGAKAGFTASATVNRKDFGVSWNKTLDNGGVMLSDEVTISLNVEANQAPTAK